MTAHDRWGRFAARGQTDSDAIDQARHRASLARWLQDRGYDPQHLDREACAKDVWEMANRAGLVDSDQEGQKGKVPFSLDEEEPMESVTVKGYRKQVELIFLEPGEEPPRIPRASVYDEIAAELKARPGQWATLEGGAGVSSSLRKRGLSVHERPNGHPGQRLIYVRARPD